MQTPATTTQLARPRRPLPQHLDAEITSVDDQRSAPTPTTFDSRRGWLGVSSVGLGSFAIVLSELLPVGLLPAIASDLQVQIGTAGLMIVITGLFAAIAAPIVTVAASTIDRRVVIIGLSALLVASDALAAASPTFAALLVGRVLLGVSLGGFWAVGAGIAGRLVPAKDVIRGTSLITSGISIATVVSLPLGSAISALSTWRLAFVIGGLIGVLAMVLQLITLPSLPATRRVKVSALGALFQVPRARVGLVAAAFGFSAQFAASTYITPFLEDRVHVGAGTVSAALLAFGIAGILGNFGAGFALSRTVLGTTTVAKVGIALTLVLLPLLAHSTAAVVVLIVVWGLAWGALPLALQTWMSTTSPEGAETGLALFVTTIQLALATGSVIGGALVTAFGLDTDFRLAAAVAFVGAIAFAALGSRSAASVPANS